MSITEEGKSALRGGADAMASAAKYGAAQVADRTQDMASDAWRYTQRAGDRVSGFVQHRRPVETALISAAVACLITGVAFWASRPD